MTDLRGDLLKIGIIPDDMPDQTNFVLFNLDELASHMIKELDKAREEGRESVIAELSISEGMEAIERFFREAPVDYDDKCNLWIDFLSKLKQ